MSEYKTRYDPEPVVTKEDPISRDRRRFNWLLLFMITTFYIVFGPPTWWTLLCQAVTISCIELFLALLRRKSTYLRIAYWWYKIGAISAQKKQIKRDNAKSVHQYRNELKTRLDETGRNNIEPPTDGNI
jgi:hypothetical protein